MKQDNSTAGYDAFRRGAAVVERASVGRLLVAGRDRAAYLQGLLTNDIAALRPREGCYAALLTAQGRMIADMQVNELGDAILLQLVLSVTPAVHAHLERFVFSEDVQVADVTASRAQIDVYGPDAARVVTAAVGAEVGTLSAGANLVHGAGVGADVCDVPAGSNAVQSDETIVIRGDLPGVDAFAIVVDAARAVAVRAALRVAGGVDSTEADLDVVRIESGRPLYGVDMDADTIPLEAGIEDRAISRTKGCYVGQEVIVRVLDRGHGRVARRLVGLTFDPAAAVPARGAAVASGDKEAGHVTSAAWSPFLARPIALAYVHRDFAEPGTPVTVAGVPATVAPLPFL